jgi:hypothetical protein
MVPEMRVESYYGHPVIKKPVWTWEIPLYFFTGGLAGGSMLLAAGARLSGNHAVARRALFTALASVTVCPALLISDLGRPSRFLNMLRVFKPTSPMSVGTWVVSAAGTFTSIAAVCELLGILPRVKTASLLAAGALGAPLSTYTAALIADTAVPVWHEARIELPFVFGATALASAGAAAVLLNDPSTAGAARVLCAGGALTALAGVEIMERRLGDLAKPYHEGRARQLGRLAKTLNGAGATAIVLAGRRRRALAAAGAAAVIAGALCERWSIFAAGGPSASDPAFTVRPQRERLLAGASSS